MAVAYDKSGKLFQVDYQSPFGGIDSSAYASAIDPHNFVMASNCYRNNNIFQPTRFDLELLDTAIDGNLITYVALPSGINYVGIIVTDTSVYGVALIAGNVLSATLLSTYVPALSAGIGKGYSIIIDQIATSSPIVYWTSPDWNEIWQINFAGSVISLVTNYIGGGILGLLDNQLMVFGGTSQADGTVPNRISWSAPGEYGQFQPYDVGSGTGSYSAGFNDLPSTSDILTGFFAIGTVGYLLRTQGITQINPTGNGVNPFQFNHLWASELGVGSPYAFSVAQYGSSGAFISDSGLYTLGLSGLNTLGATANTAIYAILNNVANADTNSPSGIILPNIIDNPDTNYLFSVNGDWPGVPVTAIQIFCGNIATSDIRHLGFVTGINLVKAFGLSFYNSFTFGFTSRILAPLFFGIDQGTGNFRLYGIQNNVNTNFLGTLTFRKEQLQFGYIPTVTKIGFIAAKVDTGQAAKIQISIDGGANFGVFPDITVFPSTTPNSAGSFSTVFSSAVASIERPQLVIKLDNIQVAEVWYQGTLADFPLI